MCMYICIKHVRLGGSGGMRPRKLDALRLLLRPFWDQSRAVVATWLVSIASNFWLFTYAFGMPADFEFPREKVLKVDRTAGGVTSPKGQLVNSRVPEIAIYLRTHLCARPFIAAA